VKLLLDEMLAAVIAEQLRSRDHDVVAVDERPDLRGLPDADLFELAQRDARAILTYNREDFLGLDTGFSSRHPTIAATSSGLGSQSPSSFSPG
jgi:predicted nuclease of predicted toxin-antitoxin system